MTTLHRPTPEVDEHAPATSPRHGWWWKTLLVGMGLWGVTILVTALTLNANLIPALILVGSFLVPLCVVLFVVERLRGSMSVTGVIVVFFLSGLFGVLGAAVFESGLGRHLGTLVMVGVIEEGFKLLILVVVGWRYIPKTAAQGALLGAIVGAGFAAFESAGYAFNAALASGGINLFALLQTEVLRAALSPVGHVLWTAILGAALFGAVRVGSRYRVTLGLAATFIAVSLLHVAWDAMAGLATLLALLLTGNLGAVQGLGSVPADVSSTVAVLQLGLHLLGLFLITVLGIVLLVHAVRGRRSAAR